MVLEGVRALVANHGLDGLVTVDGEPQRTVVGVGGVAPLVAKSWIQQCQAEAGCLFNGSIFICARHTDDDVASMLAGFDRAFEALAAGTDLRPLLLGDPVQPVFRAP